MDVDGFQTFRRKVRLIKTFIRQSENNYPLESFVDSAMEEEALELVHKSKEELEQQINDERNLLCMMQDESWDIRESNNIRKIQAAADAGNKDLEVKIKEMKEREKQKRIFEKLEM